MSSHFVEQVSEILDLDTLDETELIREIKALKQVSLSTISKESLEKAAEFFLTASADGDYEFVNITEDFWHLRFFLKSENVLKSVTHKTKLGWVTCIKYEKPELIMPWVSYDMLEDFSLVPSSEFYESLELKLEAVFEDSSKAEKSYEAFMLDGTGDLNELSNDIRYKYCVEFEKKEELILFEVEKIRTRKLKNDTHLIVLDVHQTL